MYEGIFSRGISSGGKSLAKCHHLGYVWGQIFKRYFFWWQKSGQMSPAWLCMRKDFQEVFLLEGKVWPNVTTMVMYEGRFSRGISSVRKSLAKCHHPPWLCMRPDFQKVFLLVGNVWPKVTTMIMYETRFSRGISSGGKSLAKCNQHGYVWGKISKRYFFWSEKSAQMLPPWLYMRPDFQKVFLL